MCRFLSGRECGVASCVSGSWRLLLRDEYLWSALCRRDFGLDQRVLPDGSGSSSWRCALCPTKYGAVPFSTGRGAALCGSTAFSTHRHCYHQIIIRRQRILFKTSLACHALRLNSLHMAMFYISGLAEVYEHTISLALLAVSQAAQGETSG